MISQFPYPDTPWGLQVQARILDPNGRSVVAYSMGRSNGKSVEAARLAVYFSAGPGHAPGYDVLIAGPTLGQAGISWRDAVDAYCRMVPDWKEIGVKIRDYPQLKEVTYPWGVKLCAVAGSAHSLTGKRFKCAIIDEPASFPNTRGQRVFNALRTGLGKTPDSRLIICGTRPSDGAGHWFEDLLEGSGLVWSADRSDDPLDPKTWRSANPSLDLPGFEALGVAIQEEAEDAAKSAAAMASFRNLRLNLGTSELVEDVLCTASEWTRMAETDKLPERSGPMVLGLDLGGGRSMTGAAAYWWQTGRLEVVGYFGNVPELALREQKDGNIGVYSSMVRRGELVMIPGTRTTPPALVLSDAIERFGTPEVVLADRYRKPELEDALASLGLLVEWRGLGFRDSSNDVREFLRALLEGRIKSPPSLLVRVALAASLLMRDPAGNPKIVKRSREGAQRNNDAAIAAVLAIGEGSRRSRQAPPQLYYTPPASEWIA